VGEVFVLGFFEKRKRKEGRGKSVREDEGDEVFPSALKKPMDQIPDREV